MDFLASLGGVSAAQGTLAVDIPGAPVPVEDDIPVRKVGAKKKAYPTSKRDAKPDVKAGRKASPKRTPLAKPTSDTALATTSTSTTKTVTKTTIKTTTTPKQHKTSKPSKSPKAAPRPTPTPSDSKPADSRPRVPSDRTETGTLPPTPATLQDIAKKAHKKVDKIIADKLLASKKKKKDTTKRSTPPPSPSKGKKTKTDIASTSAWATIHSNTVTKKKNNTTTKNTTNKNNKKVSRKERASKFTRRRQPISRNRGTLRGYYPPRHETIESVAEMDFWASQWEDEKWRREKSRFPHPKRGHKSISSPWHSERDPARLKAKLGYDRQSLRFEVNRHFSNNRRY